MVCALSVCVCVYREKSLGTALKHASSQRTERVLAGCVVDDYRVCWEEEKAELDWTSKSRQLLGGGRDAGRTGEGDRDSGGQTWEAAQQAGSRVGCSGTSPHAVSLVRPSVASICDASVSVRCHLRHPQKG